MRAQSAKIGADRFSGAVGHHNSGQDCNAVTPCVQTRSYSFGSHASQRIDGNAALDILHEIAQRINACAGISGLALRAENRTEEKVLRARPSPLPEVVACCAGIGPDCAGIGPCCAVRIMIRTISLYRDSGFVKVVHRPAAGLSGTARKRRRRIARAGMVSAPQGVGRLRASIDRKPYRRGRAAQTLRQAGGAFPKRLVRRRAIPQMHPQDLSVPGTPQAPPASGRIRHSVRNPVGAFGIGKPVSDQDESGQTPCRGCFDQNRFAQRYCFGACGAS